MNDQEQSPVTASMVRKSMQADGNEVRITHNGHVKFRPNNSATWLDGRYVTEYKIINGQLVHC